MNAIALSVPELVGGSADLDPSTKTYLNNCGDFEPGNYAGRNIHYGVREHVMAAASNGIALHGGLLPFAATFFNFVDYLQAGVALRLPDRHPHDLRLHPRLGLSGRRRPDARADRTTRDAARDAELLRRAAGRFARDARGMETGAGPQGGALGARPHPPEAAVPRRTRCGGRPRRLRPLRRRGRQTRPDR